MLCLHVLIKCWLPIVRYLQRSEISQKTLSEILHLFSSHHAPVALQRKNIHVACHSWWNKYVFQSVTDIVLSTEEWIIPGVSWDRDVVLTFRFIGNRGIKPCLHSIAGNKEVNIVEVAAFSLKCGMREVLFTMRNSPSFLILCQHRANSAFIRTG